MPKMLVNHKIILTRKVKGAKDGEPEQRIVMKPARKGQAPVLFDFTAAERDSILKAHPGALSMPDQPQEQFAAPAPDMQGGNQGQPGDKDNGAKQTETGGSVDGDKEPKGDGGIDTGDEEL